MNNYNTSQKKYYGRYHDTVQQVYLMRWLTELAPPMSPNAFRLSNWLGARYEGGLINNGILNPAMEWILHGLGIARDEFDTAMQELTELGLWAAKFATDGSVAEFRPLMLDLVNRDMAKLKAMKSSFMHSRIITRYGGGDPIPHAVEILATHLIKPRFNDCGYWFYKNQKLYQDGSPWRSGRYPHKQCQSVFFEHEMMSAASPEGWQRILNCSALTQEDVARSFSVKIRLSTLEARFNLSADSSQQGWELGCVRAINARGWFTAELIVNAVEETIRLTPTKKFHDLAWEFNRNPDGVAITEWERAHGFLWTVEQEASDSHPDGSMMNTLPPLGMHYLYYLKSRKTGRIISVGQTSKTPHLRERMHQRQGSNSVVNSSIHSINKDPNDSLDLVPVALVHHSVCAQREMDLLHAFRRKGHALENKIDTVARNQHTIQLDSRMENYSAEQVRQTLDDAMRSHGPEQIFIKEIPEPTYNEDTAA